MLLSASWLKTDTPLQPQPKAEVAEQYGELETMAQEARKRKLDQNAETKEMMAIQSDNVSRQRAGQANFRRQPTSPIWICARITMRIRTNTKRPGEATF